MCGLVFAGSNTMGTRDTDFFETMLYMDIIRGDHSTGVFAGYSHLANEPMEVRIRKAAVPADVFIRRPDMWDEVRIDKKPSPNGVKGSYITKMPKFLVGHNRYATMGEIVDSNAHPFQHGAVTLVHNGTLDNQSLLPDHQRFKVDSENIAHAINVEGIEETLKKLHGKFMLIWHDARDNTLNFLRNKERPFHFVETSTGDWFGASEEDMIMWLVNRPKGPTCKRHFEAEVGVQYVFDVSNGGFKFKEERKHELPTFRYVYNGNYSGRHSAWYNDYDDDYDLGGSRNRTSSNVTAISSVRSTGSTHQTQNRTKTSEETQKERLNNILESEGIHVRVGEWIFFDSYQFDQYPNGSGKGKMTGYMSSDTYVEVQAPGFDLEKYEEGGEYRGKIISCYVMNYILHIIVGPVERRVLPQERTVTVSELLEHVVNSESGKVVGGTVFTTPPPDDNDEEDRDNVDVPVEEDEEEACVAITGNGELVTKKAWESDGSLNCCANCGSPVPWSDAETTETRNGFTWCESCASDVDENGYPKDSGSDRPTFYFKCDCCGDEMHEDLMSRDDNLCVGCWDSLARQAVIEKEPEREVLKIRRKLQNGLIVTKPNWEKINTCDFCRNTIPWNKAETAEFVGQRVTCSQCAAKLEMGVLPQPIK